MATGIGRSAKLAALAAALLVAACSSDPDGQVVAKVNGDEITQQQLDAAIVQFGAPAGADPKVVRKLILKQLIDQRLIVAKANELGLNKTPEYLAASQAANDKILATLWAQRIASNVRVPLGSEVDDFIRTNPGRFDKREIFVIDQVRTAGPVLNSDWLPKQTSLQQVVQQLKSRGIPYVLAQTTLDTSDLDPTFYARLVNRDPSRPFAVPDGNDAVIGTIVSREAKPLSMDEARPVAVGILRRRSAEAAVKNAVIEYRRTANVSLQPEASASPSGQ